jgi:hypothetical protein
MNELLHHLKHLELRRRRLAEYRAEWIARASDTSRDTLFVSNQTTRKLTEMELLEQTIKTVLSELGPVKRVAALYTESDPVILDLLKKAVKEDEK